MNIYNIELDELYTELKSRPSGLFSSEVRERINEFGYNEIKTHGDSVWKKAIAPFLNVMIIILIFAAVLSFVRGEYFDGIIVCAIILINAIIEWIQTYSTEKVLRSLRQIDSQKITVRRNDKELKILATELVPGDILYLSEGEKVPADARIIKGDEIEIDESLLTGESIPVRKHNKAVDGSVQVYDQKNMIFSGSFVVKGSLVALVVATGNNTEFGGLARLATMSEDYSPIQRKIDKLIKQMILAVSVIVIVALVVAFLRGMELLEAVKFVLALLVSAVPEELPVVITVILVFGMRRMAKEKALVRNLRAIENIGEVTVIATDKTGTLTKNKLMVQDFFSLKKRSESEFAAAISQAINYTNGNADPLDIALNNFVKDERIKQKIPYATIPFDYKTAMSGNIWKNGKTQTIFLKGAPEKIMKKSRISVADSLILRKELSSMMRRGERVIAFAKTENMSKKFEFIGIVGIADDVRREVNNAIKQAKNAGVDIKMITGDHVETATEIATELNLISNQNEVFNAEKTTKLKSIATAVNKAKVFARVTPDIKYAILEQLKKSEIVAMTGDGVNDTPALTKADIGIAMGSGSQFAKDASDIILLDNNFKTIISAIREGRVVVNNIRRMLVYILSTNLGEISISVVALLAGLPLPLVAVQILWINLVTDSLLVLPLGLEKGNSEIMRRNPDNPNSPILSKAQLGFIVLLATIILCTTLGVFIYCNDFYGLEYARTSAFATLVVIQLFTAFVLRSIKTSVLKHRRSNKLFWLAIFGSVCLQSVALFSGLMNDFLHIVQLNMVDFSKIVILAGIVIIVPSEIYKIIIAKYRARVINARQI